MHRALVAGITLSWLTALGAVAQDFQFMPFAPRAKPSLLALPPNWTSWVGSVVEDDINRDGFGDLFIGGAVFFRIPTGWITPNFRSALPEKPVMVDLDGDGDHDVVAVPPPLSVPRPVLLFLNTGARVQPVFQASWLGTPVQGVAVGDIDADGFPDLVVARPPGSAAPSLVLGRGGSGMQFTLDTTSMPAGLPFGLWPELLDIDGDGDLDVLASNATSGLLLMRNSGGSFIDATSSLPVARAGHVWLKAADLDGDGHTDCAAMLGNGDVDVLWGAVGGSTFAAAVATVPGLRGLSAADLDGDLDVDLLAEHAGGLDVLWNQGSRQFTRTNVVAHRTASRGVADVDRDGTADIVFSIIGEEAHLRWLYRASVEDAAFALGFAPSTGAAVPGAISAAGDVDGDGRTDLVTPAAAQVNVDHALGGGAYRRSSSPLSLVTQGYNGRTELADMDRDGDLDLVVKDYVAIQVAANDGTGTFPSSQLIGATSGDNADDLRLADVDGDGDIDVVTAEHRGVVLFENRGGGQYDPAMVVVPGNQTSRCVEVADLDGDGDGDLVTGVLHPWGASVLARNDGTGTLTPHPAFVANLGIAPTSVRAGDIDADGDTDLLVANATLRVLRNDGTGVFTDTSLLDLPTTNLGFSSNLVVADFDNDGDLDVCMSRAVLLLNDGSGRFTDVSAPRVSVPFLNSSVFGPSPMRAADLDDDGDVDLIGAFTSTNLLVNHLRHCRSTAAPRLGGVGSFHLISGPNFGQPGLGLLGVGFALATPPLHLPGIGGQLELDPVTLQVVAAVTTSSIGVSSAFVAVPQDPVLFGLGFWAQGAILPAVGVPGLTNAVYEVVLR